MTGFISILIYTTIVVFFISVVENKPKMSIWTLLLFSLFFVLYNIYCTYGVDIKDLGYDRYNYYIEFEGIRETSYGLTLIYDFVRMFTEDFKIVLYVTTFICCIITFFAYKVDENNTIYALVFLLFTDFVFSTFSHLKQCYAVAIASLMFAILLKKKNKLWKDLMCILLIFIACLFHTAGLVLIPTYLLIRFYNPKKNRMFIIFVMTVVAAIYFEQIIIYVADMLQSILPTFSKKLYEYSNSTEYEVADYSIFSFIKGFPFYYVFVLGLLKRNELKEKIINYDHYLILTLIGSALYISSIFSYWMYRATSFFFLPIAIFFGFIIKNTKQTSNTIIHEFIVYGSQIVILIRWIALMYINYGGF